MSAAEQKELSAEELLSNAMSAMRQAYWTHVRDLAGDIVDDCKDGTIQDVESLRDRMHETCDSDGWIIYTSKAQSVLMCSDNASAGPDSLGADGFDWSGGVPWSQLAYFALESDLYEQIDAMGIDVNDDSDWIPEVDESEEE